MRVRWVTDTHYTRPIAVLESGQWLVHSARFHMVLLGESAVFVAAVNLLSRFARVDVPAVIQGETGTGKELAARAVHYQSVRRDRPFIPVNCGALPDALIENELFGHESGAYTDARDSAPGLIALADGGTLFLDEVDALSPKAQVALLRFIQDQRYRPIGSRHDRRANVRIITATNQDLERLVREHAFRVDLLFRIKVLSVVLPPLRERKGDARLLSERFLDECAQRHGHARKHLHPSTLSWIESYDWPGNVRELENFIQRECLLCDGDELRYPREVPAASKPADRGVTYKDARAAMLADFDRRFLADLLGRAAGNVTLAARQAGKERRTLGRMLKKYGIRPDDFRLRA
jgi:two-component system response regulator GlrR